MIPVTAFAGKKVAVFGLGGSGLVSASALLAGGADVVAFDDDAQSVAKANAAGIPKASEITIAANATCKLLSTESQRGPSANSVRYQSSVSARGGNPPTPPPLKE